MRPFMCWLALFTPMNCSSNNFQSTIPHLSRSESITRRRWRCGSTITGQSIRKIIASWVKAASFRKLSTSFRSECNLILQLSSMQMPTIWILPSLPSRKYYRGILSVTRKVRRAWRIGWITESLWRRETNPTSSHRKSQSAKVGKAACRPTATSLIPFRLRSKSSALKTTKTLSLHQPTKGDTSANKLQKKASH